MTEVLGVLHNIIKTESKQNEQKFILIRVEANTRKIASRKAGSDSIIRHLHFLNDAGARNTWA